MDIIIIIIIIMWSSTRICIAHGNDHRLSHENKNPDCI